MMKESQYLQVFTVFSYLQLTVGRTIDTIEEEVADEVNDNLENAADGVDYINRVAKGEEIPERPEILMFTAPYKLCEGGCKEGDGGNIALQFPVFIGRRGQKAYQRLFDRDFNVLHATRDSAPFKKRTTKVTTTTTPCIVLKVVDTTTTSTTTPTTTTITTTTPTTTTTTTTTPTTTTTTTPTTTTTTTTPTTTTTTTTITTTTTTTPTTTSTEPTTCPPVMRCPYYPPDVCLKKKKKKKPTTEKPYTEDNAKIENHLDDTKAVTVDDEETALRMEVNGMPTFEDTVTVYNSYDYDFLRIYKEMIE